MRNINRPFKEALKKLDYELSRNIDIMERFAEGEQSRLPALAAELVALRPQVLFTNTSYAATVLARATHTIPIVVGPAGENRAARTGRWQPGATDHQRHGLRAWQRGNRRQMHHAADGSGAGGHAHRRAHQSTQSRLPPLPGDPQRCAVRAREDAASLRVQWPCRHRSASLSHAAQAFAVWFRGFCAFQAAPQRRPPEPVRCGCSST